MPKSDPSRGRVGGKAKALLAIGIVAVGVLIWRTYYETYHFAEVQPGVLYRSGNRSLREFRTMIRKTQARTVVMLIDEEEIQQEPFRSEQEFCRQRGIDVVRIPVLLGERPTAEHVSRFLSIMADPQKQPVLVHCSQGVRRTAMMVAAYQRSVLNYNAEQAKEAIIPWGREWDRLADIRGFIDDYNPQTCDIGSDHVVKIPQDPD